MKVLCFNVSGAENCCLCIKARTGAYIIAILGLIYGFLSLNYMLFCFDDNMITKEIEKALKRVDKDISNIHEVYIIYCYVATTVLSTINSCFLLLGLVKNSPILLTTWLIIAGIGNWVSGLLIMSNRKYTAQCSGKPLFFPVPVLTNFRPSLSVFFVKTQWIRNKPSNFTNFV